MREVFFWAKSAPYPTQIVFDENRRESFSVGSVASVTASGFRPILWRDNKVRLIDQTRLPLEEVWLEVADYRDVVTPDG